MIRQKVVYEWECSFCGYSEVEFSDRMALVNLIRHEKGCDNNPENQFCYTCQEMVLLRGHPEDDVTYICALHGCASHLGTHPNEKLCPSWSLRKK